MIERFGQPPAEKVIGDCLEFAVPDQRVAPWLVGFAHRRDSNCGHVVFELPELRPVIQITFAEYYLRDRDDPASWQEVPRIALWGPKVTWGYGYARKIVHSFALGLTPRGFEDIIGRPLADFADRVVELSSLRPDMARELEVIFARGTAADWIRATTALIMRLVGDSARGTDGLEHSLPHLIADKGDAVRRASQAAGVGDRQFRRLFQSRYGLSPRLYRRVLRVDRLLRRLHPAPWEPDEHTPDLNFADQAHMIREFKALTGMTPGDYVRSKRTNGDATIRSVIAEGIAPPPRAQE